MEVLQQTKLPVSVFAGEGGDDGGEGGGDGEEGEGGGDQDTSDTEMGVRPRRGMKRKPDCGECVFCLDKTKYRGPNKKKKACSRRKACSSQTSQHTDCQQPKIEKRRRLFSRLSCVFDQQEELNREDSSVFDQQEEFNREDSCVFDQQEEFNREDCCPVFLSDPNPYIKDVECRFRLRH